MDITGEAIATMSNAELWHLLCAHLNPKTICRGSKEGRGISPMVESEFSQCHTCMHCKAKRTGPWHLRVDLHRNTAQPLALVCWDLAGPMRTLGIDGNRFAFILVDVFTGMV